MSAFALFAVLVTLASLFGVLNAVTLRLPNTIGVLVCAMVASLALLLIDPFIPGAPLRGIARGVLGTIDLPRALLNGALSFLLFSGALDVDLGELWRRRISVFALALVGTVLAVVLLAGTMWEVFGLMGLPVSLPWCVVLGTILAPTDPVAVVGMLRRIGLPPGLQAVFAGESLFNDGVGVVLFGAALGVATGGHAGDAGLAISGAFLFEAVGGLLLGLLTGFVGVLLVRATDERNLEVTISVALATGTFAFANGIGMSGPIAVVAAGLSLGSQRAKSALSVGTADVLHGFWGLIDEVLNSLLFLLIGFEVLALPVHAAAYAAAALAIPVALLVRTLSVFLAALPMHLRGNDRLGTLAVLTWGGLRGGISVSLALALPGDAPGRAELLTVCYVVVVFTIVVQGLSMERVARRFYPGAAALAD